MLRASSPKSRKLLEIGGMTDYAEGNGPIKITRNGNFTSDECFVESLGHRRIINKEEVAARSERLE